MLDFNWYSMLGCFLVVILFFYSEDLVSTMLYLFMYTFMLCLFDYLMSENFWSLGLLIIVMATGLFLIFAYIISINPQTPMSLKKSKYIWVFTIFMMSLILAYFNLPKLNIKIMQFNYSFNLENYVFINKSSLIVSLFLISMLILLVIFFIRFTYSKGGGLRKNF